jgi:outer membrane protein assembly complex protein YaeT
MICKPKTVSNLTRLACQSVIVLFGFVLFGGLTFAQSAAFEGRTITDIQFVPLQPLHPDDLTAAMPLKKGEPLHASDVAAAIDGLFATGQFEDIAVEGEPAGSNGVLIRFVTQLTFFIGDIRVQGKVAAPPNRTQIVSATQLSLGTPFREKDLTAAVDSIVQLLKANGFYTSEVGPNVTRNDQLQEVYLTFQITQGSRAKYDSPVIQGSTAGLSDAAILRATGWRIPFIHWWHRVTQARTSAGVVGVLSKYAKQNRLTAKAEIQNLEYDSQRNLVRPTLNITPGPKVELASVETKLSQRVLKRYVPISQEGAVYNDLLIEGQRNLTDYLQGQGYYDAEVEFRIARTGNDLERIEYVISRGPRYKLVHLGIRGNTYFSTDLIRGRLFMQPAAINMRHGRYSEEFRRKDEQAIIDLYQSNGFRDAKVETAVDRGYKGKEGQVAVTITVQEGPQWLVDSLMVNGIQQVNSQELISELVSTKGQPFSEANLSIDRNHLLTYYYTKGFPAAKFEASWSPGAEPNHVNVVYNIQEGSRQYVRDVLISGIELTRRNLVDRTLGIKAGDPLSPVDQLDAQKRLYDLGVFARIDTNIENPDGETNHKYLKYNFREADRYRLTLGFGAQVANFGTPSSTTLASPGGTTGFSPQVSVDLSRINFLGRGHTITFKSGYSKIEKRGSLSYLQPRVAHIEGLDLTYSLLYDNSLDVRTFASKRLEGSVQLSDRLSKSLTAILKFGYRRVSVSDIVIPALLVPQLLQPVRIGMLSGNLSQDRRDNPSNPTRGMYNTADIGVAARFLGSQRSFMRVLLRNATYYRLGAHLVLARQTRFGVIKPFSLGPGVTEQAAIPLPERFFGGGADSLRAFSYNQAGPRDIGAAAGPGAQASQPTGFPLGGNALLFNNVELRFPLIGENIQGVLFYDVGNVYSSLSKMSFRFHQRDLQDFNYAAHAPGFGIRYQTPIGPIRVDLAYALNPPSYSGFSGTPAQLLQCNPSLPPAALPSYCQPSKQTLGHVQFFFSIGQTF